MAAEQIVKLDDLDASLVSSGKSEAEAALGRATEEVNSLRLGAFNALALRPVHPPAPDDVAGQGPRIRSRCGGDHVRQGRVTVSVQERAIRHGTPLPCGHVQRAQGLYVQREVEWLAEK